MDKLVQSEVRKVRENAETRDTNDDAADLRAGVKSQTNIVVAALVVNMRHRLYGTIFLTGSFHTDVVI